MSLNPGLRTPKTCNMLNESLHPRAQMRNLENISRTAFLLALLASLMLFAPFCIAYQSPPPAPPAKPKPNIDNATQNAPDQPTWDPLRAEKDMQVGTYYMHKGDLDAAIDRFQDATLAKPGYAIPFLRLGEAQEKKGLKRQAIKSYRRYLDLYPNAGDKDKIQKKIDKLYKEVEKEKNQRDR
ncbi:MAG: tetratricopeptide repeat protein [Candidatus Acidiferrum sp.]